VTLRSVAVGLCASLFAVLFALAAWQAADAMIETLGLEAFRPLVVVTVLFLSLTALQAVWNKVDRIIRPPSRRGHT
jgi:hypothetical protein